MKNVLKSIIKIKENDDEKQMNYAFNLFTHKIKNDLQAAVDKTNVNDVMTALMCINADEKRANML